MDKPSINLRKIKNIRDKNYSMAVYRDVRIHNGQMRVRG